MRINPRTLLAMKAAAMPFFELREYVHQEVANNPALELLRDGELESSLPVEAEEESSMQYDDLSEGEVPRAGSGVQGSADNTEMNFAAPETLQDHLSWQLQMQPIARTYREIGLRLIGNLDDHGFHIDDYSRLFSSAEMDMVPDLLYLIRRFEPIGTAVQDSCESLCVQAEILRAPAGTEEIIREWFTIGQKQDIAVLAERSAMRKEEQAELMTLLPQLNLYPGNAYSTKSAQYIIPDLQISRENDRIVIQLNNSISVALDPYFADLADGVKTVKSPEQKFARKQVQSARVFLEAIELRQHTILNVARCIVEYQKQCFLEGVQQLRPLLIRDVADMVGMSESTISRVVSRKYVQTDWGIVPLRYFFSTPVAGDGNTFSRTRVLYMIKDIMAVMNGRQRITDQYISDMLSKKGVHVARRTVAKYRKLIQETKIN